MPNTQLVWALVLAVGVLLMLRAARQQREPFQLQTICTRDPYAPPPTTLSEGVLENELASLIDPNPPGVAGSLTVATMHSSESNDIVKTILRRLNATTDFDLHLIDITNGSKQIDVQGTQHISLLFKAHDQRRVFLREIAADVSLLTSGRLYVNNIYFTNCAKDASAIQGITSIDKLQTFAAFPSPFSDDW